MGLKTRKEKKKELIKFVGKKAIVGIKLGISAPRDKR